MKNVVLRRAALAALGALSVSSVLYTESARAEASQGFAYKLAVSVSNYNNPQLDSFQVAIKLDTRGLINTGKLQADGSDLRVVDVDSGEVIPHFIEGLNSPNTWIWLRAPRVKADDDTHFLLLMGNPGVENTADSSAVFDLWDDFNGDDNSTWSKSCGGDGATFEQYAGIGAFSWTSSGMFAVQHGGDGTGKFSNPDGNAYRIEVEVLGFTGNNPGMFWVNSLESPTGYGLNFKGGNIVATTNQPANVCVAPNDVTSGTTGLSKGRYGLVWSGQEQYGPNPKYPEQKTKSTTHAINSALQLYIGGTGNGAGSVDLDWIRVRRFAAEEPLSWGDANDVTVRTLTAPSIRGIEAGATRLSVNFEYGEDAPKAESFTAKCGSQAVSGTKSPLVVTGLSSNTSYECTVSVTNNLGEVVFSEAASAETLDGSSEGGDGDGDGDGDDTDGGDGDGDNGSAPGGDGDGDGDDTDGGDGDDDSGNAPGKDEGKKSSGGGCSVPDQGAGLSSALLMGLALLFSRRRKS